MTETQPQFVVGTDDEGRAGAEVTIVEFLTARYDDDEASECQQVHIEFGPGFEQTNHRGNPRKLADIAAKRKIVYFHDGPHECSGPEDNCMWVLDADECPTVRVLASVYSDHPEHNPKWAVS